jgi:hypothetical protein
MKKRGICLMLLAHLMTGSGYAQTDYAHYQNSNTRALSMSGAFTAVQDYHNSLNWNPAAIVLAKDRTDLRSRQYIKANFDLGALGIALIGLTIESATSESDDEENSTEEESSSSEQEDISGWEWIGLLVYSFRGVTFIDRENTLISLNLHEDIMDYDTDITHIFDNAYQTLIFSHLIGREFSLGASISYYQVHDRGERKKGMGGSIGLQYNSVRYPGLTYGLTYFTFADPVKDIRYRVERIYNNSAHFGVGYNIKDKFLFALDLKNITAFGEKYLGEVHFGFEQNIIGNVYLCEGFFLWENSIAKTAGSFGLGYKSSLFKSRKADNLDLSIGWLFNCPVRETANTITYRDDISITLRYSF